MRVAIVGSGPAGFYTAHHLLKHALLKNNLAVDIFESLPVPFGLVRFGIAPDHADAKNVAHRFDQLLTDPRVRLFGHVHVGQVLSLSALRRSYNAVVFATGAVRDRRLGLPREGDLRGVFAAQDLVEWYNCLPKESRRGPTGRRRPAEDTAAGGSGIPFGLDETDTAVVVGHGNVALDIARMLLLPVDVLAKTDVSEEALAALAKSRVRRVHLVGRRGPLQMAFTAKELREIMHLPNITHHVDMEFVRDHLARVDQAGVPVDRAKRRLTEILLNHPSLLPLSGGAAPAPTQHPAAAVAKSLLLRFTSSPTRLLSDATSAQVTGIVVGRNEFVEGDWSRVRPVSPPEEEVIKTGLVVRSVGYEGEAVPGLPFDGRTGTVPNDAGRVRAANEVISTCAAIHCDASTSGLYVSGWIKRGAVGVVAATMYDAIETAETIVADFASGALPAVTTDGQSDSVEALLREKGVRAVSYQDWRRLDAEETRRGAAVGKPREKIDSVAEMMKVVQTV
ncbi:hypothetical protein DFJ73DRAFT_640086 [Zopfochytrium polystomum]|nr:hypothetical protein DFJ73DRAFT_640086 [Zopfochytrium polystomum]